jgi:hypothetical protein
MKNKPESGAYLIMKNKLTTASFLFTSDDRPTGREGEQDRPAKRIDLCVWFCISRQKEQADISISLLLSFDLCSSS